MAVVPPSLGKQFGKRNILLKQNPFSASQEAELFLPKEIPLSCVSIITRCDSSSKDAQ